MKKAKFRNKHGPEYVIQTNFINYLRTRGWLVERMIGNQLQKGIPDLYCHHLKFGGRWVDLKNPRDYEFTQAQKVKWPVWERHGVGIWIITGWQDEDYDKLFGPPNWRDYWKPRYDEEREELESTLEELYDEFEAEDFS